jgi:hypothetical protein
MSAVLRKLYLCAALAWLGLGSAWAHKGSDAYLDVQASQSAADPEHLELSLALSVAIKDLDLVLPLDANADGKVTWGEVKAATPQVLTLLDATAQLETTSPAACPFHWAFDRVESRGDGAYLRMTANTTCSTRAAAPLALRYTLLREQDATHRLLIAGQVAGHDLLTTARPQQEHTTVLWQVDRTTAAASPSGWAALWDYASTGMHHLLEGYDHLAFLLALVLPLQLRLWWRAQPSTPTHTQAREWLSLLRTVTAFTVGHSITLVLAALGWTQASPQWVEPAIAASIGVTAWLNLRPQPWLRTDALALGFGLVHGFGFAGLLLEADAPAGLLPWALAGFNLGIEAGQLLAVGLWVLLAQVLVAKSWYPRVVVRGGSVALMLVSAWWFWERVAA